MIVKATVTDTCTFAVEVNAKTLEEAREILSLASHQWYVLHAFQIRNVAHSVDEIEEVGN